MDEPRNEANFSISHHRSEIGWTGRPGLAILVRTVPVPGESHAWSWLAKKNARVRPCLVEFGYASKLLFPKMTLKLEKSEFSQVSRPYWIQLRVMDDRRSKKPT